MEVERRAEERLTGKPELLLVTAVTAVGAAFRFWHLGGQSFWYDEVATARIVRSSFGGMVHGIWRTESTPPLYYVLGWIWVRTAGHSETAIRSLSAAAGTAAIAVTYLAGRRLVSRSAGLLAASFVALSPFLIWYSQEARAYSLFVLLGAVSLWAFAGAWTGPTRGDLALWAGISILLLWTEYFALFFVLPEAVALLARREARRTVVPAVASVVAGAVLVTPLLYHQSGNGLNTWIAETPWRTRAFDAAQWWVAGAGAVSHIWLVVSGLVVVTATLLAAKSGPPERRGALIALGVGLAVVVGPLLAAALGEDFWLYRNLIVAWMPLVLVLSAALTGRAGGRILVVVAAAIAVVLVAAEGVLAVRLVRWQVPIRDNWRGFARCLGASPASRLLVIAPSHNGSALMYYRPEVRPAGATRTVTVREIVVVGSPAPPSLRVAAGFRTADFACDSGIPVRVYRSPQARTIRPALVGPRDALFLERR
ncbi:MAG TPA: glycosyltransferase family 39 protein [Gaiellaceae bacterium]